MNKMNNKVLNIVIISVVSVLLIGLLGITIYNKVEENKKKYSYNKMLDVYKSIKYDDKMNVYLFHGETCPHCQAEIEFFSKMESEYKETYNLYKFEVWNNENNKKLKEKVVDKLISDSKIELTDEMTLDKYYSLVPFLIIGEKVIVGYSEALDQDIKDTILEQKDNEYDIMKVLDLK